MTTEISAESKAKADSFKVKGNEALKENRYDDAISFYTQAIEIDSKTPSTLQTAVWLT